MQRPPAAPGVARRRWLPLAATLAFVAIACGLVADTLVWFRLERQLDRRVSAFVSAAGRHGWTLQARRGQRGGWPFAATLRISGLALERSGGGWPGGLGWSGDTVELSLSPLHPALLHAALPGTQGLHAGGLSLRVWGSDLALDIGAGRVALSADALHLARTGAGPDEVLQVAGVAAEAHWRPDRPGGTDLSVTLHQAAMPLLSGAGDGPMVRRGRLVAVLRGTPSAADRRGLLSAWAAGGGAIELREASLDWPDAGLFLSGTLSPHPSAAAPGGIGLDGDLLLAARDPALPLSVLRRAGLIGAGQETAILAVTGLVAAGEPAGTAPGRVDLPLSLRDGVLRLGAIPLLSLR